jgi:hypothetical protein
MGSRGGLSWAELDNGYEFKEREWAGEPGSRITAGRRYRYSPQH